MLGRDLEKNAETSTIENSVIIVASVGAECASPLCTLCINYTFCRRSTSQLVTDDELANSEWIRDLRTYAAKLCISPDHWHEWITAAYRDAKRLIVDRNGAEVSLDMEEFELIGIRYWFRTFCVSPAADVTPRIRVEARERVRILASILRARDPDAARMWGFRAANDNSPI